jgi:hypothetical protein
VEATSAVESRQFVELIHSWPGVVLLLSLISELIGKTQNLKKGSDREVPKISTTPMAFEGCCQAHSVNILFCTRKYIMVQPTQKPALNLILH